MEKLPESPPQGDPTLPARLRDLARERFHVLVRVQTRAAAASPR
jgi:hypothetical protein